LCWKFIQPEDDYACPTPFRSSSRNPVHTRHYFPEALLSK